jgi:hypothetical protein
MIGKFSAKIQNAVSALLHQPAACTPELRQRVEAYAARLSGGERDALGIPADLEVYVNKVALHAFQVTDKDIQHLKDVGYSEDAIFEITLCAALGAAGSRMERGIRALKGARNAPTHS